MRKVGISGHRNLSADSQVLIAHALKEVLANYPAEGLRGVTCLAQGADQIFAHAVIQRGGTFEVILPSSDYRDQKVPADNRVEFDELIARAAAIHTLPFERASRSAYMAASEYMLAAVDEIIAVWDGNPSAGYAGTADVVACARDRSIPVTVLWPSGAARVD